MVTIKKSYPGSMAPWAVLCSAGLIGLARTREQARRIARAARARIARGGHYHPGTGAWAVYEPPTDEKR